MPRMIDLIRAQAVPPPLMLSAARGALSLPSWERVEILLHLVASGSDLREQAQHTLDELDHNDAESAFTNPLAAKEVLQHLVARGNLVSEALPRVLRNHEFRLQSLVWIAAAASRENADILLASLRVCESLEILNSLNTNPNLSGIQSEAVTMQIEELLTRPTMTAELSRMQEQAKAPESAPAVPGVESTAGGKSAPETAREEISAPPPASDLSDDPEVAAFFKEHETDLANVEEKGFEAFGEARKEVAAEEEPMVMPKAMAAAASAGGTSASSSESSSEEKQAGQKSKKAHAGHEEERGSALQKISKLDVKGRIQLAMKGNKEERSILVRDGTKLVALAVLDSPKITDGEVEKFASQRNVQEAVLRAIPMKRRFMKNYVVVRNLVSNPRMPIDLALGLMKNLLVNDLKNLSGNKEVSETVRKLALKMFKQKTDTSQKHS